MQLEEMENNREELEHELEDAKQQFANFDQKLNQINSEIAAALQRDNKEKLRKDLEGARTEIKKLDKQLVAANKEHSELFQSKSIATDLLSPVLSVALDKLKELHDQGKIPNTTIPVLHDRLEAEVCICGETLKPGDPGGDERRAHIQQLIDDSERADQIRRIITGLYYSTKSLETRGVAKPSAWLEEYQKVFERRSGIQDLRNQVGRKLLELERQLDSLPDTDIRGLRETSRE